METMSETNRRHLVLLLFFFVSTARSSSSGAEKAPINRFVWSCCEATLYPRVCYASLCNSSATDPLHLAIDATNLTLARLLLVSHHIASIGRSTASAASSLHPDNRTASALKDCMEELEDAEDLVRDSAGELVALSNATGASVAWHVGNAQTWLSAALTNEDTCIDGFSTPSSDAGVAGKVEADVVPKVERLKQFTSNALALVNRLVHR